MFLVPLGLSSLFGELLFAADGDGVFFAFFAGYEFVIDEEIPHGFGALGALRKPVLDAFFLHLELGRVGQGVIGSQDFQRFPPWITCLFRHNEAVLGLFGLPDTG